MSNNFITALKATATVNNSIVEYNFFLNNKVPLRYVKFSLSLQK